MKFKIIFAAIVSAMTVSAYFYGAAPSTQSTYAPIQLNDVEALAVSELGCRNMPDKNDGHCVTDGTMYFCANTGKKDCVIGHYD